MADEKISAMPGATEMDDADVFPIVQGGVNKKCTRGILLTAAPGGDITVRNSNNTASLTLQDDSIMSLAGPSVSITIDVDANITLASNGQMFMLNSDGSILISPALPASDPGNPGQLYAVAGVVHISL